MSDVERAVEMLNRHVECVRGYLHSQIGKPKPNLESAPEIALNNLKSEVTATLTATASPQGGESGFCVVGKNFGGQLSVQYFKSIDRIEPYSEGDEPVVAEERMK